MPLATTLPWSRCLCGGSYFRLDLTFQHGQFMRYECKACRRELHIKPDLKLSRKAIVAPSADPLANIHAHIDWVTLPVVADRLNPRRPLPEMAGLTGQIKTMLDDSNLTRREQMAILQQLAKDLLDEASEDEETVEMKPDDINSTKH